MQGCRTFTDSGVGTPLAESLLNQRSSIMLGSSPWVGLGFFSVKFKENIYENMTTSG